MSEPITRKRYSPRRPREERREEVLDAALRLVDRDGFAGLTVEAISREVDLAKTVVYDAVGPLPEIVAALLEREQARVVEDIAAAMPSPPFESPEVILSGGLNRLLEAVHAHPASWRLVLLSREGTPPQVRRAVDAHRNQLREMLEPIVRWGLDEIDARDLDAEITTHVLLATVESAVGMALDDPASFTPERFAQFARGLVRRLAS